MLFYHESSFLRAYVVLISVRTFLLLLQSELRDQFQALYNGVVDGSRSLVAFEPLSAYLRARLQSPRLWEDGAYVAN